MSRLAERDLELADEIVSTLRTMRVGAPSVLGEILAPIRELLDGEQAAAYSARTDESGARLEFLQVCGIADERLARARILLGRVLEKRPQDGGFYDATCIQNDQRNVALTLSGLRRRTSRSRTPIEDEVMHPLGVREEVRTLICEGPAMLAWVGAFRRDPFGDRERLLLQRLVPALRDRLVLENQIRSARLTFAALETTLEAIGAPAFLVRGAGSIVLANSTGQAEMAADRRSVAHEIHEAVTTGREHVFRLTKIVIRGVPDQWLAIRRARTGEGGPRLSRAGSRYALTPRQLDVLGRLAVGASNKAIAADLGCAESTIELHVTQILHKTECKSRSELVARFWTDDV